MPSPTTGTPATPTYRFGFREATQNGDYYYLNGVRVNFRGDNLQGADYDRINNGGKGDAYDTLPGFLPPSSGNGGWPQAVDNYQRLNYNVVRIHQEPGEPVHVGCRRRDGPDDHRRGRDSRLPVRAGVDRRARQHGQPRPCAGPARPQPPRGHPLESEQRAEPERPGFRTVREGPVRGDERRRRHPADHCRGGRRRRMSAGIPG